MSRIPTDEEIFSTLREILSTALRVPSSSIASETGIFTDLGAESLDILDIRFRVEQAYGLRVEDGEIIRSLGEGLSAREIQQRLTVGSLVRFIQKRLGDREC